jgi:hypothetical protein
LGWVFPFGSNISHHFDPIYFFRFHRHSLRFMDLEWEGVPMDLQGTAWNIERLIYHRHAMVVPMD